MPEPVFEWYKDKTGKFRFRLKAANGEIILTSEAYTTKEDFMEDISSVKVSVERAEILELSEPLIDRVDEVRKLMTNLIPTKIEVETGSYVNLDDNIVVTRRADGRIVLWEVE